jgi:hypothetical protein
MSVARLLFSNKELEWIEMDEALQLLIKHKLLHIFLNIMITEKVLEIKEHNCFVFNKSVHEQNNEVNKKRKWNSICVSDSEK